MGNTTFTFGSPAVEVRYADRDPGEVIDIVFISEGYTSTQLGEFQDAVGHMENSLFMREPFNRYKNFFNVKWVNLISTNNDSDTALDWKTWSVGGSLMVNMQKIKDVLAAPEVGLAGPGQADVVMVVVRADNYAYRALGIHPVILDAMGLTGDALEEFIDCPDPENPDFILRDANGDSIIPTTVINGVTVVDFGYSTGFAIVPGQGTAYEKTAVHEFGHAFAGLFDEYADSPTPFARVVQPGKEAILPNIVVLSAGEEGELDYNAPRQFSQLSPATQRKIKWHDWIEPGTSVPNENTDSDSNVTGLFIGGGYESTTPERATYRPQNQCVMQNQYDHYSFCTVCREALIQALYSYEYLNNFQRVSPDADSVVLEAGDDSLIFSVEPNLTPADPDNTDILYDWFLSPPEWQLVWQTYNSLAVTREESGDINCAGSYHFLPDWEDCLVSVTALDFTPWIKNEEIRFQMYDAAYRWKKDWSLKVEFNPALAGSPWPTFHHDTQRTGRGQTKGPLYPFLEWSAPGPFGDFSGPVLGEDGALYIGGQDRDLLALQYEDGLEKWRLPTDLAISTPLVGSGGVVYAGLKDGSRLFAVNTTTHAPIWVNENTLAYSPVPGSLAVGKAGTLYLGSIQPNRRGGLPTGNIDALTKTGEQRWSYAATEGRWFDKCVPAVGNNGTIYSAYFGSGDKNGYLQAVSTDGQRIWRCLIGTLGEPEVGFDGFLRGPVLGDGGLIIIAMGKRLCAVQDNSATRWQFNFPEYVSAFPVTGESGTLYVGAGSQVYAFNQSDGSPVWPSPFTTDGEVSCMAMDSGGILYAASGGALYGLVGGTQRFKWSIPFEGIPTALVIGDRETIYINAGGRVHAVTEALFVEGTNCNIRVCDSRGRTIGPPPGVIVLADPPIMSLPPIPGATCTIINQEDEVYTVRVSIPHPIKDTHYQVDVLPPMQQGLPTPLPLTAPYSLWVVEGTNRYPLAENISFHKYPPVPGPIDQSTSESYDFRYPAITLHPRENKYLTLKRIIIRPDELSLINGQAVLKAGAKASFTAMGVDHLGQEWVIPARWQLSRSVGGLKTLKENRAQIIASPRTGVKGQLTIQFQEMTAHLPVRVVSGRQSRRS